MQDSWCWACTGVGDGDNRTVDDIINQNMLFGNLSPDVNGIIYWKDSTALQGFINASDGLLAPTNPAGNTVRIASGVGLVQGWLYVNDADVDFDVSGGAANATDLIVLRRSDPATVSTVRLALVRGPAAGTATVTQTATTFEIAIAEVLLDGSGDFSALTDIRQLANRKGALVLIEEIFPSGAVGIVTFSGIEPLFRNLIIEWQSTIQDALSNPTEVLELTFNSDVGANYYWLREENTTGAQTITGDSAANFINCGTYKTDFGAVDGANAGRIIITNYAPFVGPRSILLALSRKSIESISHSLDTGAASGYRMNRTSGFYNGVNTGAINRIDLEWSFGAWKTSEGARVMLYGEV